MLLTFREEHRQQSRSDHGFGRISSSRVSISTQLSGALAVQGAGAAAPRRLGLAIIRKMCRYHVTNFIVAAGGAGSPGASTVTGRTAFASVPEAPISAGYAAAARTQNRAWLRIQVVTLVSWMPPLARGRRAGRGVSISSPTGAAGAPAWSGICKFWPGAGLTIRGGGNDKVRLFVHQQTREPDGHWRSASALRRRWMVRQRKPPAASRRQITVWDRAGKAATSSPSPAYRRKPLPGQPMSMMEFFVVVIRTAFRRVDRDFVFLVTQRDIEPAYVPRVSR